MRTVGFIDFVLRAACLPCHQAALGKTPHFSPAVIPSPLLRRPIVRSLALLVSVCSTLLCLSSRTWASETENEPIAPLKAPFDMPQLVRPVFPKHMESIAAHGAIEGGSVKNTEAIAKAIKACADAGGGRVLVPAGRWLTGPVHLRSNIDLHLAEGAELIFSDKFEDYLPVVFVRVGGVELFNYSPLIYARDCTNIAITGKGRLNGNAKAWWVWAQKRLETKSIFQLGPKQVPVAERIFGTTEAAIRPSFVVFMNCKNVLMESFTIGGGPNWTLHPIYCENIIIRRVTVDTDGPNNDGIDPDSCRNLLVEYCTFNTGDDCLVLKSGYNEDGWRVNKPTENVIMRHCLSKRGHGGLVIGSEMSGSVRNVYMHDCQFEGTDRAVRIKSRGDRGGVVEKVWVENIQVRNMQYDVVILNMDYSADRNKILNEHAPIFRDIHLKNIRAEGAPIGVRIEGMESSPIENISFADMHISSTRGVVCNNAKNLSFENVSLTPAKGPAYEFNNTQGVKITGATAPAGMPLFLKLSGAKSGGIEISSSQLNGVSRIFETAPGLPSDAVVVK